MTTVPTPPSDILARYARDQLTRHGAWDSPHEFAVLTWDGTDIGITSLTIIDTAIHPTLYPETMVDITRSAIRSHYTKDETSVQLLGVMLQFEAYAVVPPKHMTIDEREALERDRRERRFAERNDAVEMAQVILVDVNGRMVTMTKRRGGLEEIEEYLAYDVWNPAPDAPPAYSGAFVSAIQQIAKAMHATVYGQ